ncbi:MAG TPA: hypothetical protein VM597_39085 [Gemmataceae bacterium]|nr:hypothetical protein [Gemmataceae bacterium]
MNPEPTSAPTSPASGLATALALGRARHRGRPWGSSARTLLAACGGPQPEESGSHFLVVDSRFGTPIYVFLEIDPAAEAGFPGFGIQPVTLETADNSAEGELPAGVAIGRDPGRLDQFRGFRSNGAVAGAGFILIEPRYVGPNWSAYLLAFRPEGDKPAKRARHDSRG